VQLVGGTRPHLPALDGLRGVAVLVVMLHHMTVFTPVTTIDHGFAAIVGQGWGGVDLFFVLSGFLITGILLDAKPGPRFFRNFYARRVLRIFPLYYTVVFFSLVILPLIPHAKAQRFGSISGDEPYYWLHLSNFSIALREKIRHGILDVSWSLAIEEQFYLIWPLLVFLLKPRTLLKVCAALIVVSLGARFACVATGRHWLYTYALTPCRMDGLALGGVVAILTRRGVSAATLRTPLQIIGVISLAALIAMRLLDGDLLEHPWGRIWAGTLVAFVAGWMLVSALAAPMDSLVGRFFANRFLRMLGKYSYALYLFHLPLRALIRDTVYGPERFPKLMGSQLPGQLLFYVFALAISLAAAMLSWHLYEKHFLKLKRFFPERARMLKPEGANASPAYAPHTGSGT